jgi:hypothetical protein
MRSKGEDRHTASGNKRWYIQAPLIHRRQVPPFQGMPEASDMESYVHYIEFYAYILTTKFKL